MSLVSLTVPTDLISEHLTDSEREFLSQVASIAPSIRERFEETEKIRHLPQATLDDFGRIGVPTAMRPHAEGGAQIGVSAYMDMTRILARSDASAGWLAAFYASHNWLLSQFPDRAQAEVLGSEETSLIAATGAGKGVPTPAIDGYTLSGRWGFASGVMHSNWVVVATRDSTGRGLSFLLPISDVVLHDTWHVPGMRGTGSNDVEVREVFVPSHRVVEISDNSLASVKGREEYPTLAYPRNQIAFIIHPTIALGMAESALGYFRERVVGRRRPETGELLADEALVRAAYGKAEHAAHSAKLLLRDVAKRIDDAFGDVAHEPTLEDRARIKLAISGAARHAMEALDIIAQHSGSSSHRAGDFLEHVLRDQQIMRSHRAFDWDFQSSITGGILLGSPFVEVSQAAIDATV